MIKLLSKEIGNKKYLNTQEIAFGFLALGKFARLNPIGSTKASIVQDGNEIAQFDGKDIWLTPKSDSDLNINVTGEGNIFYFVESQGIPIDDKIVEKDNHLKVRRTFYNRNKLKISDNRFNQNDLIVVKISLQSLTVNQLKMWW